MTKKFSLLAVLLLAAACRDKIIVVPSRLAPGGGSRAAGGMFSYDQPNLDIVVRMESNSTNFNPQDLMRLEVDGVNQAEEMMIGGTYAVLRISPAPVGQSLFVQLFRRIEQSSLDTGTYDQMPYTGPTLASVAPDSAQEGTQVTITGTGFSAGTLRVFFGGVEGTVDAASDTSITATVPVGAYPGLVWVLVDDASAYGVVGFQPLDSSDQPIDFRSGPQIYAIFPGNGIREQALELWGRNYNNTASAVFDGSIWPQIVGVEDIDVPPVGDLRMTFAIVSGGANPASGNLRISVNNNNSNELPFVVVANP